MELNRIPFDKIPGQGELYYDYLRKNPRSLRFYSGHHRDDEHFLLLANRILSRNDYQRKYLATILKEINSDYCLTAQTEENIKLLEQEDALVVLTGRQAGLYTGSIYTLYKAICTIKVAEYLSKTLKRPVIPIFWMETSDYDVKAVNQIAFPGRHSAQRFTYSGVQNTHNEPIGSLKFNRDFERFAKSIKDVLPKNDFYDAITRLMDETYRPGESFGRAFGRMMMHLLGAWGLVIVDSENIELKKLASPVITMRLLEKGRMNELIREQSEELVKENYREQIKVKSELLNVFIYKDNTRIPLNLLGEVVSHNGTKVTLQDNELLEMASEHPEWFSPKVAFRPVVQSFLFPIVAYVGGPTELEYFAQLKKTFDYFDIEMPIIWPKSSVTLVDEKIIRHMERTGITPEDIFRDHETVLNEILERKFPRQFEEVVDEAKDRLSNLADWLAEKLTELELPPNNQFKSSVNKMLYQIESIKYQNFSRLKARNNALVNSWKRVQVQLCPESLLQERVYNVIYFLSRHGFWLIEHLMEYLDITQDDHQLLEIPLIRS